MHLAMFKLLIVLPLARNVHAETVSFVGIYYYN